MELVVKILLSERGFLYLGVGRIWCFLREDYKGQYGDEGTCRDMKRQVGTKKRLERVIINGT